MVLGIGLVIVIGIIDGLLLRTWAWPWRAWLHGHGVIVLVLVLVLVFIVFVDMCYGLSPRLRMPGLVPVRAPRHVLVIIQVHVAVAQPMRVQFG